MSEQTCEQTCKHPHIQRIEGQRYSYLCTECGRVVTARQMGLNPRANPNNRNKWALRNWKRQAARQRQ